MHAKMVNLVLVCSFVSTSAANASDIYKWTDVTGQVHYGQEHPPGAEAEHVRIVHDARTPEEQQAAQAHLNKLVHEAGLAPEQVSKGKAEKAQEQSAEAATAETREHACTKARHLELKLGNWAKRAVVENADGTQTRLNDDQRQALIDRTEQQVKNNCDA